MRVFVLDSTLRAGALSPETAFRRDDALALIHRLDAFGVDVIETAPDYLAPGLTLQHARLAAFGEADPAALDGLLAWGTPLVTLAGESWDARVYRDLSLTGRESLDRISGSVSSVKAAGRDVVYDAAHFFDGYLANPEFALRTLDTALEAGADVITLCDSNGGTLPHTLARIAREVRKHFGHSVFLGIQARNDADVAVANTFAAVEEGFQWVQGTINGYGPRCGWANLCSVLPGLELKLGHTAVWRENLERLTELAQFAAAAANRPLEANRPWVGRLAAAGEEVGNRHVTLVADLLKLARDYSGVRVLDRSVEREIRDRVAMLEAEGYEIEPATGTFELIAREAAHPDRRPFDVIHYEVSTRQPSQGNAAASEAQVTLLANGSVLEARAAGSGPVHALDLAMRTCLGPQFPALGEVRLIDYRVQVLDHDKGSAARVRVTVEWSGNGTTWTTCGIAQNVIEASWRALVDGIRLELMRLAQSGETAAARSEDYSWAV